MAGRPISSGGLANRGLRLSSGSRPLLLSGRSVDTTSEVERLEESYRDRWLDAQARASLPR